MNDIKYTNMFEIKNEDINNIAEINKDDLNKMYNIFCVNFVNQLKKDLNFEACLIERNNKKYVEMKIDKPKPKFKRNFSHDHKRTLKKHSKVEPFNIKSEVK